MFTRLFGVMINKLEFEIQEISNINWVLAADLGEWHLQRLEMGS